MEKTCINKRVISGVMAVALVFAMNVGVLAVDNNASAKKAAKKVTKITLSKKSLTVMTGNEKKLKIKGVTAKQFKKIKWTVSDASVASVSSDSTDKAAHVFGYKAGSAKITAKYKKKTYTCKVTVKTGTSGRVYLPMGKNNAGKDIPTAAYWSYNDSWFSAPASTYDQRIATISTLLAWSSIPEYGSFAKGDPSFYVKRLTDMLGFEGHRTNADYKVRPTTESLGVAFAKKSIVSNGKTYTLVLIVPRSSGYEKEWASNLLLGSGTGDHEGFKRSSEKLMADLKQYISDEKITGDVKLWFAGHSRGATASNLSEAYIADHPGELSDAITITKDDIYGYNLSCIHATTFNSEQEKTRKETEYPFIHNIEMPHDAIARLIPESYGFTRYGVSHRIDVTEDERNEAVNVLLKSIDSSVYGSYVDNDPEKNDADGIIDAFEAALKKTAPDRQSFVDGLQKTAIETIVNGGDAALALGDVLKNLEYKGQTPNLLNVLKYVNVITIEHYLQVIYCFLTDYRMRG